MAEEFAPGTRVSARFLLTESVGALGDLGTFIPLVVGLVQIVGLDAATVLVFAGLLNVFSGLFFRIPIPVQPMKAIAALALGGALSAGQVSVAGFSAGLILLLMSRTGLITYLSRVIPKPVVRALQATVGVQLAFGGVLLALRSGAASAAGVAQLEGPVVFACVLALMLLPTSWAWKALGLCALGLVGAWLKDPGLLRAPALTLWRPRLAALGPSSPAGIWMGALPQLPLTLLNSVFAVSVLASRLYPHEAARSTPEKIALSVGLMNLVSCPFGGMPVCHGSGGLAAQHRFGARSGVSMVMLGGAKLLLGLLLGGAALAWMQAFPVAILGVFLVVAGVELMRASGFYRSARALPTALVMVAVHRATGQLLLGFVAGWIVCALLPESLSHRSPSSALARLLHRKPSAGREATEEGRRPGKNV